MRERWKMEKLGLHCKTSAGGTPLKRKSEYYEKGTIPWLRSGEVGNRNITEAKIKITEIALEETSVKIYPENSVLIAMYGATAGEVGILRFPSTSNQAVCAIFPSRKFIPEFQYYFFLHFKNDLVAQAVGNAQPNISQTKIKNTLIPIIDVSEQKQIVALLDQAFAAIDQAKENVERNIENAQELFDSKKEEIFENLFLEFELGTLVEICNEIFAGGDAPKDNFSKKKTREFKIPIIANAVKKNGLYGYTNEARVTEPSITIAARGSGTGHTEYRDYPYLPIVRLIVLIPNTNKVDTEFLMYAIKNLTILRSGSAIPQLTIPMIKGYSIPMPELDKQFQVVRELNKLELILNEYESKSKSKLLELEQLKNSILLKAFSGELKG